MAARHRDWSDHSLRPFAPHGTLLDRVPECTQRAHVVHGFSLACSRRGKPVKVCHPCVFVSTECRWHLERRRRNEWRLTMRRNRAVTPLLVTLTLLSMHLLSFSTSAAQQ